MSSQGIEDDRDVYADPPSYIQVPNTEQVMNLSLLLAGFGYRGVDRQL